MVVLNSQNLWQDQPQMLALFRSLKLEYDY